MPYELKRGAEVLASGTVKMEFGAQKNKRLGAPDVDFEGGASLSEDFETGEALKWDGNAIRTQENQLSGESAYAGDGFLRLPPAHNSEF